jgi:hypothetical protein
LAGGGTNSLHAGMARLDLANVDHTRHFDAATDDGRELLVLETDGASVDHLGPHLPLAGPEGMLARRQDVAEAAVKPDERPLVVFQIQDKRAACEGARLHDLVELLVNEPRRALRDDLHLLTAQ